VVSWIHDKLPARSFARRLAALAKLDLIVLDDFAISPIGPAERNDLLELLDDRIGAR
jgi:DNA replication protein DnaC